MRPFGIVYRAKANPSKGGDAKPPVYWIPTIAGLPMIVRRRASSGVLVPEKPIKFTVQGFAIGSLFAGGLQQGSRRN